MDSCLKTQRVLILDCQATGASPKNGQLLEIGWAIFSADQLVDEQSPEVERYLVQLPEETGIPPAVTRVTGIDAERMTSAISLCQVWMKLDRRVRETADGDGLCPAAIHFARYETPFLKNLYQRCAAGRHFPLQVICTHEISRRLLPGLPRKGLRAVAGYFGYSAGPRRRSSPRPPRTPGPR